MYRQLVHMAFHATQAAKTIVVQATLVQVHQRILIVLQVCAGLVYALFSLAPGGAHTGAQFICHRFKACPEQLRAELGYIQHLTVGLPQSTFDMVAVQHMRLGQMEQLKALSHSALVIFFHHQQLGMLQIVAVISPFPQFDLLIQVISPIWVIITLFSSPQCPFPTLFAGINHCSPHFQPLELLTLQVNPHPSLSAYNTSAVTLPACSLRKTASCRAMHPPAPYHALDTAGADGHLHHVAQPLCRHAIAGLGSQRTAHFLHLLTAALIGSNA